MKTHIQTLGALHHETRQLYDRLSEEAGIRADALKLHKRTKSPKTGR